MMKRKFVHENSLNPIISVLIPVWNRAHTLRRAVDSVLAQSYQDFELILVDDGSTDDSLKICREYEKADRRVKVFSHMVNRGVSAARNTGIRESRGKYIRFVDSDDELSVKSLEYLIAPFYENDNIELVMACMDGDSAETGIMDDGMTTGGELLLQSLHPKMRLQFFGVCNKLYLRSVIESNALLFDESRDSGEDVLFNFGYYACIDKAWLSGCIVYHIHHPRGESGHLYSWWRTPGLEEWIRHEIFLHDAFVCTAAHVIPDYKAVAADFLVDLLWGALSSSSVDYPAIKKEMERYDWEKLLAECHIAACPMSRRFLYRCLTKKRPRRLFLFFRLRRLPGKLLPACIKTKLRLLIKGREQNYGQYSR